MKPSIPILCLVFACFDAGPSYAAGPYVVDDGDIVEPGQIQNEFWYTHSDQNGNTGIADAAYQIFPNLELTLQVARDEQPTGNTTSARPQLKYVWYDGAEKNGITSSIAAGTGYAFAQPQSQGAYLYIPTTFKLSETFTVNADIGWQYTLPQDSHAMTWGIGGEYTVLKPLVINASIFGRTDNHQGYQFGPHFDVSENLRIDLVYGHNATGNSENSGTIAAILNY